MAKSFWWGTAIENTWIAQQGRGERQLDEFEVTQHYRFLRDDIRLAADLGVGIVRYSAPWYRVNPTPGRFEWGWLDDALAGWRAHNIEIVYDFVHYGTPLWMDNGYINSAYPERVAEYAGEVASRYGNSIRFYTPFNEPYNAMFRGGRTGVWPPYVTGDDGFTKVAESICRGIVLSVEALRAARPDAAIMTANSLSAARMPRVPGPRGGPGLYDFLFLTEDVVSGRVDEGHRLHAYFRTAGVPAERLGWFVEHRFDPDVFGVNYYPGRWYDRPTNNPDDVYRTPAYSPHGAAECLDVPSERRLELAGADFEACLRAIAAHTPRPLFITETSGGYDDAEKVGWLTASTEIVRRLRAEGVDIVGYLWWPLFDAVRWDWREGRRPAEDYIWKGRWNNGLYTIRTEFDGTQRRVPTAAVETYRAIIHRGMN
jgi:beta-glucosidase/6-phospho-beta-glucosidase/beta-galactosidase